MTLQPKPTDFSPDLEVAAILDSIAEFPRERELNAAQASSIEQASARSPTKNQGRDLPSKIDPKMG